MATTDDDVVNSTSQKVLVVSTAGGRTNAGRRFPNQLRIRSLIISQAPLLEISSVLSQRGYTIEFGTLEGQEHWVNDCKFISRIYVLGHGISTEAEEENYARMSDWKIKSLWDSWQPVFDAKAFLESTWPQVYLSLVAILENESLRPNFILADYLVEAARDVARLYNIPIAMHWPQMPTAMLKNGYTPGIPGLSVDVLTSEHATFWQRLKNELMLIRMLPPLIKYKKWRKQQRVSIGVHEDLLSRDKPNHLLLVNSFFGLTPAIDTPPNVATVGPILGETYDAIPPQSPLQDFMMQHKRVVYISMGTHVLLSNETVLALISGAIQAIQDSHIDGIVWAIRGLARKQLIPSTPLSSAALLGNATSTLAEILDNRHADVFVTEFAPQRAILNHEHTRVFITHGGASSTNEACFHGVPTICLGVYFDQLQNSMRMRDAGIGISLRQHSLRAEEVTASIITLVADKGGTYHANVKRIAAIAAIAVRRKVLAADLIEEALADHTSAKAIGRPSHRETADMRMPLWKRKNLDLKALATVFLLLQGWMLAGIPLVLNIARS